MLKKSIVSATMLGVVLFALASSGGGKKKTSSTLGVIPISAKGTFTLKSRPSYSGSHILSVGDKASTTYRSVITYQKGNTTYLIPSKYNMANNGSTNSKICFKSPTLSFRSNLNIVDLKIRLCK